MGMNRLYLLLACAAIAMGAGCSNPASSGGDPQGPTVDIADFVPLEDGFTWTYVDSSSFELTVTCEGPQSIAGYTVYETNDQYFFLSSDGWYFVDYPYYNTPVRVMEREISTGSSCSGHGNFESLTWTCLSTDASVSVEAGDFTDCVKIKEVGRYGGQTTTERHLWLAPGVGLVKQQSVIGGGCDAGYVYAMGDAGLLEIELSSYFVGATSDGAIQLTDDPVDDVEPE